MIFLRWTRDVASIVTLLLSLGLSVFAQSQPPAPSPTVGSQAPQQQPASENAKPDGQDAPVATIRSQQPTEKPTQDTTEGNPQSPAKWWDWFIDNGANWTIVLLTLVLAVIGGFQWWATHTANKHNAVIERAYVDLSHTAPGVHSNGKGGFLVTLAIKNHGNTPADILGGRVWLSTTDKPGYQWVRLIEISKIPSAYIHPTEVLTLNDLPVDVAPVILATHTVWLAGELYYRDRFGDIHESGFGRHYIAALPGNNLVFDESTEGMNYDRRMKQPQFNQFGEFQPPKPTVTLSNQCEGGEA